MMLKSARSFRLCLLAMAGFVVACGCDGGGGSSGGPSSSLTSTFKGSSTGLTTIRGGDTIQFEVTVTTIANQDYKSIVWSLGGDVAAAVGSEAPGWAGVSHNVTNWAWNYTPSGSSTVKIGTTGNVTPDSAGCMTSVRVAGLCGFSGATGEVGDGIPATVGIVTITADTVSVPSSFLGGAFQYRGGDGFLDGSLMDDPPTVNLGSFTVVP